MRNGNLESKIQKWWLPNDSHHSVPCCLFPRSLYSAFVSQ